jgi:hypothetical protein
MQRHSFDPVSAAIGVLAVILGLLVLTGELSGFDSEGGWWIAVAAVIVGLAIIPWRGRDERAD